MTRNMATADRLVRLTLGALLIILAAAGEIGLWGFIGIVFVGTAFVSFCPIYRVIGIQTCRDC